MVYRIQVTLKMQCNYFIYCIEVTAYIWLLFYISNECFQPVIMLKHVKQAGFNHTVVLNTDYCQTF